MIHFIKEGMVAHLGLNITTNGIMQRRPWITFNWVWYNPQTYRLSSNRLRIRTLARPYIYRTSQNFNVIEGYLMTTGQSLVSQVEIEDAVDIVKDKEISWFMPKDNK